MCAVKQQGSISLNLKVDNVKVKEHVSKGRLENRRDITISSIFLNEPNDQTTSSATSIFMKQLVCMLYSSNYNCLITFLVYFLQYTFLIKNHRDNWWYTISCPCDLKKITFFAKSKSQMWSNNYNLKKITCKLTVS